MIYITFNGTEIEIPYEESSLYIQETIDSTLDSGFFKSIPLSVNLGALDYTKRIPRDLDVRIDYNGNQYYMKTGETKAEKYSYHPVKYVHSINLISRTESITKLPLENMTVTQPKGDYGQYSRSVNTLNETLSYDSDIARDVWNIVDNTTVSLLNTVNSNTSVFTNTQLLVVKPVKLIIDLNVWNKDVLENNTLTTYIKYNGSTIFSETFQPTKQGLFTKPKQTLKSFVWEYEPSIVGTFTLEFFAQGVNLYLEDVSFAITSLETIDKPVRTNAQVIDKMLRNTEYVLDTETRARLNVTATENTYNEYTVYDATQFIASEEGALVKVGLDTTEIIWRLSPSGTPDITADYLSEKSPYDYPLGTLLQIGTKYYTNVETSNLRTQIGFMYFDNPNIFDPVGERDRTYIAELDDYVSALELNTRNVIKPLRYSPYLNGFKTLRNNGVGRFDTANLVFETEDNIDRVIQVKVKGFACSSATYTILATDEIDITERVVEQTQYDSFNSESDYTLSGKAQFLKNNTLYYVKGSNKILGMSYTGEHLSTLIGTANVVRSLYECILATLSNEYGELFTRTGTQSEDDPAYDGDLVGDLAIQMQVTYANITTSRARIYKDDQSGFNRERIKYLNESASINETENIGNYGQLLVNRLGGTKLMITGVCDHDELANVGDRTTDGYVYTVINKQLGHKVSYTYTLVKDYNVISSYIGTKSAHRVEEISSSNTVDRTLRYTSKVIFTDTPETFTTRLIQSELVFSSLFGDTDGLQYGYLECNLSNGDTKRVHLSLDSDSKGKTIEIKWKLANNFSAGLKRYSIVSGSDTVWLTSNVPYTDYYGKVNDIQLGLYFDTLGTIDLDDYPEASSSDGDDLFAVISDTIDKDAREIIGGLIEIPILSNDDSVMVYNGMARYNKLVNGSDRIRAAVLTYEPLRTAQKIDLARVYDVTSSLSGTVDFGILELSFTSSYTGIGVAFYNVDTLDLVLVIMNTVTTGSNTITRYYKVEDGKYGGGYNIIANIILSDSIEHTTVIGNTNNLPPQIREVGENETFEYGDDYWQDIISTESISHATTIGNVNRILGNRQINESETFQYGDDYWQDVIEIETISHTTNIGNVNRISGVRQITETTTYDTLEWKYTTETGYSYDLIYTSTGTTCATFITILNWLKSNYSANDYGLGTIVRVTRNSGFICSPVYYYYKVE